MHIPHLLTRVSSLINYGTTSNFTDLSFTQQLRLPLHRLNTPIPLKLADGKPTHVGAVKNYTFINLQISPYSERLRYYLTHLSPSNPIILRLPWLQHYNPYIH